MRGSTLRPLTPEEDAIDDLIGDDDEIDDTLPADLWFRHPRRHVVGPRETGRKAREIPSF
jgi:hypothetical protein